MVQPEFILKTVLANTNNLALYYCYSQVKKLDVLNEAKCDITHYMHVMSSE